MVLEKTLESPLDCKEIKSVNPKGYQSWIFIGRTDVEAETNTLATWCEELTHWKRPWCWERLRAGGEGDNRGWDGWMASLTPWTWVWVCSRSWWWTGRLQSMGSQEVGHDWAIELNWTVLKTTRGNWWVFRRMKHLLQGFCPEWGHHRAFQGRLISLNRRGKATSTSKRNPKWHGGAKALVPT